MMNNINLQIDAAARQVSQNGKAVYLTQTEFDLLLYLLDNAGRITTRSELLAQVWGITAPIHTRTVDMHIAKLRHKLGAQIEQALENVYAPDADGESPELEAAAALVRSRYMKKLADGRRDLVVAALQRRGFAYSVIKEAIKGAEEE